MPHNAVSRADSHPRAHDKSASHKPEPPPACPFVLHACFSAHAHDGGGVLVTVDAWLVGGGEPKVNENTAANGARSCPAPTLKFWHDDVADGDGSSSAGVFTLGATVPRPHGEDARNGGCEITALAYHPHVHVAVTAAGNGGFKAWSRVEARAPSEAPTVPGVPDEGKRAESSPEPRWQWECSLEVAGASGGGRRTGACAFSPDGSVLAFAHCARAGHTVDAAGALELISLWDGNAFCRADGEAAAHTLMHLVQPPASLPAPSLATTRKWEWPRTTLAFPPTLPTAPSAPTAATSLGRWLVSAGGAGSTSARTSTTGVLTVWDLLSASIAWSYTWPRATLLDVAVAREATEAIALGTETEGTSGTAGGVNSHGVIAVSVRLEASSAGHECRVLLFAIDCATPIFVWHLGAQYVHSALFVPPTSHALGPSRSSPSLIVLTRSCEMLLLETADEPRDDAFAVSNGRQRGGRGRAQAPEKLAPRLLEADSKVLEQAAAASTAVGDLRPPRNRFASIALDQFTGNLPPPTEMCVAALSLHLTSKASKGVEPLAAQRVSDRMHVPPSAADPTPAARAIIPPAMAPRVGLGSDLLALYARDR